MKWLTIFSAACLDDRAWSRTEPTAPPSVPFDERAAWLGSFAEAPGIPLRIEAAAWQGKLTSFEIIGPWSDTPIDAAPRLRAPFVLVLFVAAVCLGLRTLRRGRGDRDGALRLSAFVLVCAFLASVVMAHHTPTAAEVTLLARALGQSLVLAVFVWAAYMAFEPYVRRHWPRTLISWSRLVSGDVRNPVVAGHVLVGMAAAGVDLVAGEIIRSAAGMPRLPLPEMLTVKGQVGLVLRGAAEPAAIALALFFLLFLARLVLRRTWLAVPVVVLVVMLLAGDMPAAIRAILLVSTVTFVLVGARFGVLPLAIAFCFQVPFPATTSVSAWYATPAWLYVSIVLAVTIWAFRHALGGRQVWQSSPLDG